MPKISYIPDNREIEIEGQETILQASLRTAIIHTHDCGGKARCSTCRVLILNGLEYCSPPNIKEQSLAQKLNFPSTIRLACQTRVSDNVKLRRLVLDNEDALLANKLATETNSCSVGEEKELAIMFADIRGFTTFSEKMLPFDVVHMLNRYFHKMGQVISSNDGYIDNYMGDGLLAIFGRNNNANAPLQAVKAGLEMLDAIVDINKYIEPLYKWKVEIGIGIHYGEAIIGTIGAIDNQRETVIGDAVNFASRIETVNKEVGTNLLVSEPLYKLIKHQVKVGKQFPVKVKGKTDNYNIFEIIEIL